MSKISTVSFSQIIEELLDNSKPFSPIYLHRFSDLNPSDLSDLKAVWERIDTNRRVALMEDLEELYEAETIVCFDNLSFLAIKDNDPRVRSAAIRLLWETNNSSFWRQLIDILKNDPEETVRASAASGLGTYVYQGEIEEFPENQFNFIETVLLDTLKGKENVLIKQKCLESLGFSSNKEIPALIEDAFSSKEIDWKVSALFAMGRSADQKRWKDSVLKALRDQEPEIRFEAIRAAGELGLKSARQILLEMLVKPANREDKDIFQAIIWSLSQIGGDHVREALSALQDQAENDEEEEFIGEAIENLGLTEGMDLFNMMEFDVDDDLEDQDHLSNDDEMESELDGLYYEENEEDISDYSDDIEEE